MGESEDDEHGALTRLQRRLVAQLGPWTDCNSGAWLFPVWSVGRELPGYQLGNLYRRDCYAA
jgi:hypothetical protein